MSKFVTPKSVLLSDAKDWAKKWQSENRSHAKAFYIPSSDLVACLIEMDVLVADASGNYTLEDTTGKGIRAYMSIKRGARVLPSATTEKLLLVGTKKDKNGIHRDIVEGETITADYQNELTTKINSLKGSGIFDVTLPCPNECDTNSPLYNP